MADFDPSPALPADLEAIFTIHKDNLHTLLEEFMPVFCDHVKADRIFLQPRNPHTRVCKVMQWRRDPDIPRPAIPGAEEVDGWFVEDKWEIEDPLWRAAMELKPSIYVEDLEKSGKEGVLNIDFEKSYMFHTAFIHGHAHWPPISSGVSDDESMKRQFFGSVQPAVFDGPRVWSPEVRLLVEKCLIRIAPFMKAYGRTAPGLESFKA